MDHGYGSCSIIRYESRHASGKWIVWPGALIHTLLVACILRCTHICGRVQFDGDIVCIYIYTYPIVFQFKPGRTEKCGYKTYKTQQNGMFFSDVMAPQWVYKMGIYPAANFHNTFYGNPSGVFPEGTVIYSQGGFSIAISSYWRPQKKRNKITISPI